jgi:HK97 family phage portal protein
VRSLATLRRVRNDAPVPLTSSRGGAGGGVGGGTGTTAGDLLAKMGAVPTLFAVVNRTSTATAALDWHLYRVPADGRHDPGEDREEITTKHAAVDLWRDPNPFMSTSDFVEACQQHIDLVGETTIVVTKAGKIPVEMWPVRPDRMTPISDPHKFLVGWIYKDPDGNKIPLDVTDVIQIKMPNPSDPYRGLGPVQALLADLDSMRYSAEWSRNFFLNSAEPGGVIELPTHLSDPQWDEFVQRWREQHGGVSRAHRVAVIEHGGKYVPRGFSMRDLMFPELRAMGRDTVYEAFGVSLATMGVTEGVNYAAAKAARTQFAELLTVPRANRWRGALNRQLLPMFEPSAAKRKPGQPVKRSVEFDYDSPVSGDDETENAERESKANTAKTYIDAGWSAPSVAEALGLPDGMVFGTPDEQGDPDRDLLVQVLMRDPAGLAPTLLPLLLPDYEGLAEALKPAPPPAFGGDEQGGEQGEGGDKGGDEVIPPGEQDDERDEDDEQPPSPPATAHAHPHVRAADPGAPQDVDLSELAAAHERAMDAAMRAWKGVRRAWRAALHEQIVDIVDRRAYAELATLTLDSTDAAAKLRPILADATEQAYAGVVREALAQGVYIPPRSLAATARVAVSNAEPVEPVEEPVPAQDVAAIIAALQAAQAALAAGTEAIRLVTPGSDGQEVAGEVDEVLAETSTASAEASIGGAVTGAQNRGRRDAYAAGPVGSLYAVETLDKNTCGPCGRINGRFIATTDDMGPYDALYTSLGGYKDCEGRQRCRGTVTGVWRPQTTSQPRSAADELPTAHRQEGDTS